MGRRKGGLLLGRSRLHMPALLGGGGISPWGDSKTCCSSTVNIMLNRKYFAL